MKYFILSLSLFVSTATLAETPTSKTVATFNNWEVAISTIPNYGSVCQIKSVMVMMDKSLLGVITIWQDPNAQKEIRDLIHIEVAILDSKTQQPVQFAPLFDHKIGNKAGVQSGILREDPGFLLFFLTKSNFKLLLNPEFKYLGLISMDVNNIGVPAIAPSDGLIDAVIKCETLK